MGDPVADIDVARWCDDAYYTASGAKLILESDFDAVARELAEVRRERDRLQAEIEPLRSLYVLAADLRKAWADFDDANLGYAQTPSWHAAKGRLDGIRIAFEAYLDTLGQPATVVDEVDLIEAAGTDPDAARTLVEAVGPDMAATPTGQIWKVGDRCHLFWDDKFAGWRCVVCRETFMPGGDDLNPEAEPCPGPKRGDA
jgi:hypothetical protein